ncbi:MAG: hypothetical protein P4M15_11595 [Alphaproteobacteria bacterium]|nr:hypothetical protein [Alphaproteobacteria bacterium]
MSEEELLLKLVFQDESGKGMRPAEIQLLLAHMAEILKEIQESEAKSEEQC